MFVADAFVAEVAADLVDRVNATDQQTLQIQLETDAQIQVLMQLIVVGDKRPRGRAAVKRLQDGRFHLQHTLSVQEVAQRFDRPRPLHKHIAHGSIHRQIGIALPIARFDVFKFAVFNDAPVFMSLLFDNRQGRQGFAD